MPATEGWRLKPLNSSELPALIDLPEGGLTLGRDASNAVVLESLPHVSSFHARIALVDHVPVLEDLGSSNGSLVNGKEVQRAMLKPGDVLQLGRRVGPRFLVVARSDPADLAATVNIGDSAPSSRRSDFGATTILHLRKALGLPQGDAQLRALLDSRHPRFGLWLAILLILLIGGFAFGAYYLAVLRERDLARVEAFNQALRERLERELGARLGRSQEELRAHRDAWEREKSRLEQARASLQTRIVSLESGDRLASDEIGRLREELAETSRELAKYKPVDLNQEAQARQEKLEASLACVVYIEKRLSYRDRRTGGLLHGTKTGVGWADINLEQRGVPFYEEGGGSGFCISSEGYVVTNAHVVEPRADAGETDLAALGLEPVVRLAAVFSGGAVKYPLEIVKVAEGDVDLALVRMKPFEGMPCFPGLDGDPGDFRLATVSAGSELRLFGFPFGRYIPQDGETLTASVFAGIVSRNMGKAIQVHAAIYPGNSGGPVVDLEGRLVGVVTSVQTLPSGQIASDIGFVVPASRLSAIWPIRS